MVKSLGPVLLLIAVFFVSSSYSTRSLYRYWHVNPSNHFYTTNWREIGQVIRGRRGNHNYISEGVACHLEETNFYPGLVPLYRYFKGHGLDHFYTTNAGEIGTTKPGQIGRHGYRSEGIVGYCYSRPTKGTVPFYRYWKPQAVDHFYTTNPAEIGTVVHGQRGRFGYISEGIACYVYPNLNCK